MSTPHISPRVRCDRTTSISATGTSVLARCGKRMLPGSGGRTLPPMAAWETDYLVVGAGAAGMAFTDEVVTHTERDVVLADRRHLPGGHWLDAYPFVTLHLPSAFYGVNSRPLGSDRIEQVGLNAGLYERASGTEIRDYYRQLLDERFLRSGRVRFLGLHEFETSTDGSFRVTSHLTGETQEIVVRRKLVDATYLESSVPATHEPDFDVDPGVRCITINELARMRSSTSRYVVIGAGK